MPSVTSSPIYFWREFEEPYGFLCQWYDRPFTGPKHFQGPKDDNDQEVYRTAEMWMMVQKARLFGDEDTGKQMLKSTNPAKHRALGRKVKDFDGKKWDEFKSKIVEEGNYYKFKSNKKAGTQLRESLLETGDRELVEASPYDRIWGVGYSAENAAANRGDWGQNLLGKAIMRVRHRLRQEKSDAEQNN